MDTELLIQIAGLAVNTLLLLLEVFKTFYSTEKDRPPAKSNGHFL